MSAYRPPSSSHCPGHWALVLGLFLTCLAMGLHPIVIASHDSRCDRHLLSSIGKAPTQKPAEGAARGNPPHPEGSSQLSSAGSAQMFVRISRSVPRFVRPATISASAVPETATADVGGSPRRLRRNGGRAFFFCSEEGKLAHSKADWQIMVPLAQSTTWGASGC